MFYHIKNSLFLWYWTTTQYQVLFKGPNILGYMSDIDGVAYIYPMSIADKHTNLGESIDGVAYIYPMSIADKHTHLGESIDGVAYIYHMSIADKHVLIRRNQTIIVLLIRTWIFL